jgi:hypothetical protein
MRVNHGGLLMLLLRFVIDFIALSRHLARHVEVDNPGFAGGCGLRGAIEPAAWPQGTTLQTTRT